MKSSLLFVAFSFLLLIVLVGAVKVGVPPECSGNITNNPIFTAAPVVSRPLHEIVFKIVTFDYVVGPNCI